MKLTKEADSILQNFPERYKKCKKCRQFKQWDCLMPQAKTAREISIEIQKQFQKYNMGSNDTWWPVMKFTRVKKSATWFRVLQYLRAHENDSAFNSLKTQREQINTMQNALNAKITTLSITLPLEHAELIAHPDDKKTYKITALGKALLTELEPIAK